eukprot:9690291-Lingulodinium_polyedra.AAC.1
MTASIGLGRAATGPGGCLSRLLQRPACSSSGLIASPDALMPSGSPSGSGMGCSPVVARASILQGWPAWTFQP